MTAMMTCRKVNRPKQIWNVKVVRRCTDRWVLFGVRGSIRSSWRRSIHFEHVQVRVLVFHVTRQIFFDFFSTIANNFETVRLTNYMGDTRAKYTTCWLDFNGTWKKKNDLKYRKPAESGLLLNNYFDSTRMLGILIHTYVSKHLERFEYRFNRNMWLEKGRPGLKT
jgi:hypothetical protein